MSLKHCSEPRFLNDLRVLSLFLLMKSCFIRRFGRPAVAAGEAQDRLCGEIHCGSGPRLPAGDVEEYELV